MTSIVINSGRSTSLSKTIQLEEQLSLGRSARFEAVLSKNIQLEEQRNFYP
jgi:hypothetical protein